MSRIPGGFILVARSTLHCELMDKPPLYAKLWLWMLLRANFKDTDHLRRGQLMTSIDEMRGAMAHKVGFSVKRPTREEVRSVLVFPPGRNDHGHEDHTGNDNNHLEL